MTCIYYRLCVAYFPPPRIQIGVFRTGQFFIISFPYMITEICKIRFFVTFCVTNLPWYTHSSLPRYRVFQFCLDIHSLNENDIKKWWSMYLFRPVPKNFSGRVNPFEFEGGGNRLHKDGKVASGSNNRSSRTFGHIPYLFWGNTDYFCSSAYTISSFFLRLM